MNDINKRLLIDQENKPEKKEVEKVTPEKKNPEEFKFNDVSEMDKSNDKSSTRYDAKFIDDDDMNYDPEMVKTNNNTQQSE